MRVLVADDDSITRRRLRRFLENWGHQVLEAQDGVEALEKFVSQDTPPEMVITDWMMPEVNGLQVARQLRGLTQSGAYVYVILLTSRGDTADLVQGFKEGGVDDYVVKPFDVAELEVRVSVGERVVRLERAQREYSLSLERIVRRQTSKIRETQEEIVVRLFSALESRDEETGDHVRRIGLMSALLAENLGWSNSQVDDIRGAAPMHDIGKIGIPDAVLRKPGRLNAEEFEIIKTHTTIGGRILHNSSHSLVQMAQDIALGHHERWDGGGYPRGLAESAIPLSARIVAVVDVYDALVNDRVYRPAMPEEDALEIMRQGRGKHFDPDLLDLFMNLLPRIHALPTSAKFAEVDS